MSNIIPFKGIGKVIFKFRYSRQDLTNLMVNGNLNMNEWMRLLHQWEIDEKEKIRNITAYCPDENSCFITYFQGNQLFSCFYHSTKRHSATACGKTEGKSIAGPGEWAIVIVIKSNKKKRNKTYYNSDLKDNNNNNNNNNDNNNNNNNNDNDNDNNNNNNNK